MDVKPQLIPKLKALRLSGILETLDVRNRQAIDARPAPRPAVEAVAERRELAHVPPVRLDRVRRVVALLGEERRERRQFGTLAHAGTPTPSLPANASISASARSTRRSFFFCLSRTGGSSGSSSPKLAFIGWKWPGSASRR